MHTPTPESRNWDSSKCLSGHDVCVCELFLPSSVHFVKFDHYATVALINFDVILHTY